MSFLDLYQGDQQQTAKIQPNEGTRLPSGFDENMRAAWSDGRLFSQSIAQFNARGAALDDYAAEVKDKTGFDLTSDLAAKEGGAPIDYDAVNFKIAALNKTNPSLNIPPLSDDEIDKRALAKAQDAHRTYDLLNAGEKTFGGKVGSFLGSAGASAADPINILALAVAPETGGASILGSALRWGAVAGVSQAAIEASSGSFKEQVQPGYMASGEPLMNVAGAAVGGAVLGGTTKALGNLWSRVKTGQWPTSVRDAGNVIESEANVTDTNIFPGVEGEVAHRQAMVKSVDDIYAGRPVDVSEHITPELQQAAAIERVISPAVKVNDKIYTGINHAEALQQAADELGVDIDKIHTKVDDNKQSQFDAWVTSSGRFVDSKEAARLVNSPHEKLDSLDQEFLQQTPAKQLELPLTPDTEPMPPKLAVEPGPTAPLQTPEQMRETLTSPEHQDVVRGDIDRAIDANAAEGKSDIMVPGIDENGNHVMRSVNDAVDEVDAYKKAATDIQACATMQEAAE